jgi:hypothetical protein
MTAVRFTGTLVRTAIIVVTVCGATVELASTVTLFVTVVAGTVKFPVTVVVVT